jgi:hypothetical protein
MTCKPGDLPSAVVTREHVGRGVLAAAEPMTYCGSEGRLRSR